MNRVRYIFVALAVAAAPAWGQTNSKQILTMAPAELVAILKNPAAPAFDKAKACQRLASVGTKDAVPALAALLADENLNIYARYGLEGIPDPAADAALRDATAKLQGRQLVGVIDSIGQRKDAQAIELLTRFLANGDAAVASAAAGALGRIGTTEAATVLTGALAKDSPVKNWIADGCLACAEGLVANGKKPEAITLLELVAKSELPKHIKAAAIIAQLRIQGAEAKELLLTQLRSADKTYFNIGLTAAREMPGVEVAALLAAELERLPPERQASLLLALGDRKEPAPMPLVLAAYKSPSGAVREAAILVLAKHGDASAAGVLLDAALDNTDVAETAKQGLKNLSGTDVDAAIVARLAAADAKAKIVLFEIVGARRIAAGKPAVSAALADGDETIRIAATTAMGSLAEFADLDTMIAKALATGSSAETAAARSALRTAVLRMSDREACGAKLAEAFKAASPANRVVLLELLGELGGQKALATVAAEVKSSDPATKDAATRVLGGWPNADAAPALLDLVKSETDARYRTRALRGYIRIARQFQMPAEARLGMYHAAMELAKRNEEKVVALGILTRIPSAETVALAASNAADPALKAAATDAAVKIAVKLVGRDPKAVAQAMQKVVDAKVGGDVEARAKQLLGQANAAAK